VRVHGSWTGRQDFALCGKLAGYDYCTEPVTIEIERRESALMQPARALWRAISDFLR
jgi:predicted chitinase